MNGFANHQLKKLVAKLERGHVHSREIEGKRLDYIEGWFAISEANAIFGFAGWDREMVQCERVFERSRSEGTACGYLARVRITVRAGEIQVVREGTGFGQAIAKSAADAHERALKTAETDATKRALATFGNRFGLALYDKDQNGVTPGESTDGGGISDPQKSNGRSVGQHHRSKLDYALARLPGMARVATARDESSPTTGHDGTNPFCLIAPNGEVIARALSPEGFCAGLRQLIEASPTHEVLLALEANNHETITALRQKVPELKSQKGEHFSDILERLIARKLTRLAEELSGSMTDDHGEDSATEANGDDRAKADVESKDGSGDAELIVREPSGPTAEPVANNETSGNEAPSISKPSRVAAGRAVDKSKLLVAGERRVRNKAHLRTVAAKPCLICEELPCHAHHITFAQPRGLSIKASDEFTVPLCAIHHNELHAMGNEHAFWRRYGVDPLHAAAALWQATLGQGFGDAKSGNDPKLRNDLT